MRTKLFEELAPDYRACGRHEDFFTIYRLGPRKRDSCERALMQLADRPFSLEIALKFFRAQKMAAQEEKTCVVPSVNLAVPKHLKNAKPREFRSKKHNYLWVQDKKEKEEPMATDEEYRLRVVDLTDGFDKKDSLKNERKKISDILSRTVFLQQSPKVTYPSDYLKRLLATITAAP